VLNDQILNIGANAMRTAMAYLSLHFATPDSGGSNETSAVRQPSAWAPPAGGDLVSASVSFTGGQPLSPVKAVSFWNAEAGGQYYGYYPIQGDQAFNGSGQYTLGAFTLVGGSN
jgi:hypothetical protein